MRASRIYEMKAEEMRVYADNCFSLEAHRQYLNLAAFWHDLAVKTGDRGVYADFCKISARDRKDKPQ